MAKTIRSYESDGLKTLYPIDFDLGYLDRTHIYVYLESASPSEQLSYTWVNSTQIELDESVQLGITFNIRRIVPRDAAVNNYVDGAVLKEKNLDDSFVQALMILEEIEDGWIEVEGTFLVNVDIDLQGNKLLNVSEPTEDTDGVNKKYIVDNFVDITGDTMSGPLDMTNNQLLNLPNATSDHEPATYLQLLHALDGGFSAVTGVEKQFSSLNALRISIGNDDHNEVTINSFHEIIYPSTVGPKGGHKRHRTGGTNTSPTVGSPVAVSTIGTGTQAGYVWDGDGVEWFISPTPRLTFEMLGAVGDDAADDSVSISDALKIYGYVEGAPGAVYRVSGVTSGDNVLCNLKGATIKQITDGALDLDSSTNVRIYGGTFESNGFKKAITGENSLDLRINKCRFKNYPDQIDNNVNNTIIYAPNSTNLDVSGNSYLDVGQIHLCVIGAPDGAGSTNVNFDYTFIKNSTPILDIGLGLHNDSSTAKASIVTAHNLIADGYGVPVQLNGVDDFQASNAIIKSCQNGFVIASLDNATKSTAVVISNPSIIDARDEGILLRDVETFNIGSPTVKTCEFGISVQGGIDGIISAPNISDVTSLGTGSANDQGISLKPGTVLGLSNVDISEPIIREAKNVGIQIGSGSTHVKVSGGSIKDTFASESTIGIYVETLTAAVSNIEIEGTTIYADRGAEFRSGQDVTVKNSYITSRTDYPILMNSLDGRPLDALIEGNTLIAENPEYALRIDENNVSSAKILRNNMKGNGVSSVRLQFSGDLDYIGNTNLDDAEYPVISCSGNVRYEQFTNKYQAVTSSLVNINKNVNTVFMQSGSGTLNLKHAHAGRLVEIRNSSGGVVTMAPDSGDSVSSATVADGVTALYEYSYSTTNWNRVA